MRVRVCVFVRVCVYVFVCIVNESVCGCVMNEACRVRWFVVHIFHKEY